MKNLVIIFALALGTTQLVGQTMRWVGIDQGKSFGKCTCAANKVNNYQCFVLEYIPAVSGTLTSYTTGFLISCTSKGSPIVRNEACNMAGNNRIQDGCSEIQQVLVNSSGNTGTTANKVTAGTPVYLHQVCFQIPQGETITITEETNIDLTTSIDRDGGGYISEFPAFVTQTVSNMRQDTAIADAWLDFHVTGADRISQLDWSVTKLKDNSQFVIEHSTDGVHFAPIGELKAGDATALMNSFQFIDPNAVAGDNYYRLALSTGLKGDHYSPVRKVNFGDLPFKVEFSPNPATSYLNVNVSGHKGEYEVNLIDINGVTVMQQKPDMRTASLRLDVQGLQAGVYTLKVTSGENRYTEKVVIADR